MVQTKEEFIKSRNLQKEYVERQVELRDACYYMISDTDLSYIRFTQPNLDCDLDVFIKELQAIKEKIQTIKNVSDIRFVQHWTGHEDCEFYVSYSQLEDDGEFNKRVDDLYDAYVRHQQIMKEKAAEKKRLYQEELEELNKKYNIL